ncbi:hypothetical protein PRIPAC_88691 [Pristionchus pacificus]|uniref:C2H2-type domain-containing protein n=1 Tax=Pristionchus pacificus TaxID=54126 RepID=A0A2A6CX84_PRIPA|nr:hypothetical protein PRIPAC_88691 [Pristionchus pacificus]|eukprot:PDM82657.1 hypothetical protein PRIPAC_37050 [Pristionchus pacificus]
MLTKASLNAHKGSEHQGVCFSELHKLIHAKAKQDKNSRFKCEVCGKLHVSYVALTLHKKKLHSPESPPKKGSSLFGSSSSLEKKIELEINIHSFHRKSLVSLSPRSPTMADYEFIRSVMCLPTEPNQSTMALLVILLSSLALTSAQPCSCESSASEFTDLHFNCPIDNFCSDSLISGSCGKTCHSSGSFHSSVRLPPTMTLILRSSLEATVVPDLFSISTMVDRCCVPTLLLPLFSPLRMLAMFPLSPVLDAILRLSDISITMLIITRFFASRDSSSILTPITLPTSLYLNKNTCAVSGGEDSSKTITSVSCKGRTPLMRKRPCATAGMLLFDQLTSSTSGSCPRSIRFVIMLTARNDVGTRLFFQEMYETYIKLSINPFYAADSPIQSTSFDQKATLYGRKYLV